MPSYDRLPEHQIFVLRHAHRPPILPGEFGDELSLTDEGKKASIILGKNLHKTQWGEIHSSPLKRCLQTARYILKGLGQEISVIPSQILGDPGPFVSDPEKAGPVFMKSTPQAIAHLLLAKKPIPGMRTIEEGSTLFMNYLQKVKKFPSLMISHDMIIALLSAHFLKTATEFPHFLEGLCITIDSTESRTYRKVTFNEVWYK
jgi:broad specificity phosphatase PhoE